MPPSTRRYEIVLSVNAGGGGGGSQPNLQDQKSLLDGVVDRMGRYLLGVQGLRMAWHEAQRVMEEYYEMQNRQIQNLKTNTEKAVSAEQAEREYYFTGGAKEHPEKIPELRQELQRLQVMWGMKSEKEAALAMRGYNTEVSGYVGEQGKGVSHLSPEQYKDVREKVGMMAATRGVSQQQSAALLSAVVGSTDWQKLYGAKGGEHAIASWEQVMTATQFSHGSQDVNLKNIALMIREALKPDRTQGIVKAEGEAGIQEVTRMGMELGEFKPAQAEMMFRNAMIYIRNLKNKAFQHTMKGAGIDYGDPLVNIERMVKQYETAQESGKIKEGETFEDWLKAEGKSPMRAGFGLQAILTGENAGVGQRSTEAMQKVTVANAYKDILAVRKQMPSTAYEQAEAMQTVAREHAGRPFIGSDALLMAASSAAHDVGHWGQLDDPRGFFQKGGLRSMFPGQWGQAQWDKDSDKLFVGDSSQAMMYRLMLDETRKGEGRMTRSGFMPKSKELTDEYMQYGEATRRDLFQRVYEDVGRQFGPDKYLEIFERMVSLLEAQAPKTVPSTAQTPTLVRH